MTTYTPIPAAVPFVDLQPQLADVGEELTNAVARVLHSGRFIGGPEVAAFETAYAGIAGVRHCIGVANGTDAIELALRAAGVGQGSEVVLPAATFVATAEAVVRTGATPVFVDVDPIHHLMDSAAALAAVTPRTRAVIPVHLRGQLAPMELLTALPERIVVIEDAAQAHGALRHGAGPGVSTFAAATSFYPGKNLGAAGDAGALLTQHRAVDDAVRCLADHGRDPQSPGDHSRSGINSRLDALQAAVLRVKLSWLDVWTAARVAAAERYAELLAGLPGVELPGVLAGNDHVWHLYAIGVPDRDRTADRLQAAGIGVGKHYARAVHQQPAFAAFRPREPLPQAEHWAATTLSLPLFPGITADQQEHVAACLERALL